MHLPVSKTLQVSSPAGWYDDPADPTQQRYWDGNTWTDQRRAQQGPSPYQGQFGAASQYGQAAQHGQVYGGGAAPSEPTRPAPPRDGHDPPPPLPQDPPDRHEAG